MSKIKESRDEGALKKPGVGGAAKPVGGEGYSKKSGKVKGESAKAQAGAAEGARTKAGVKSPSSNTMSFEAALGEPENAQEVPTGDADGEERFGAMVESVCETLGVVGDKLPINGKKLFGVIALAVGVAVEEAVKSAMMSKEVLRALKLGSVDLTRISAEESATYRRLVKEADGAAEFLARISEEGGAR